MKRRRSFLESKGDLDERADIEEVIIAIDKAFGFDEVIVETTRARKLERRGGFTQRLFLEKVETDG